MVGTGRFELPTPRTPSECSTRLSHVPTGWNHGVNLPVAGFLTHKFYTSLALRSMWRGRPARVIACPCAPYPLKPDSVHTTRTESSSPPDRSGPPALAPSVLNETFAD